MYFQNPGRKSEKPGRNSENLEEIQKTWKKFQKTFGDPENNKFKKLPNFI